MRRAKIAISLVLSSLITLPVAMSSLPVSPLPSMPVPHAILRPNAAVERAISDGLGDVLGLDVFVSFQVGDRAGDSQDFVVRRAEEAQVFHGGLQERMDSGLRVQSLRTCRGVMRPLT